MKLCLFQHPRNSDEKKKFEETYKKQRNQFHTCVRIMQKLLKILVIKNFDGR